MSGIKYIIPQSTSSPLIDLAAIMESFGPHDLTTNDQTSEKSYSTNDREDEDQADMDYVPQDEAFKQELSKDNSPPGI